MSWTDEKLDGLEKKVDDGFAGMQIALTRDERPDRHSSRRPSISVSNE